jgi:hypothetical protein
VTLNQEIKQFEREALEPYALSGVAKLIGTSVEFEIVKSKDFF